MIYPILMPSLMINYFSFKGTGVQKRKNLYISNVRSLIYTEIQLPIYNKSRIWIRNYRFYNSKYHFHRKLLLFVIHLTRKNIYDILMANPAFKSLWCLTLDATCYATLSFIFCSVDSDADFSCTWRDYSQNGPLLSLIIFKKGCYCIVIS